MREVSVMIDPADMIIFLPDGDESHDLRSDFRCVGISLEGNNLELDFRATANEGYKPSRIKITFTNCIIIQFEFEFRATVQFDGLNFIAFFRDRILQSNHLVNEFPDGKKTYRIAFDEGQLELHSDSVIATIEN